MDEIGPLPDVQLRLIEVFAAMMQSDTTSEAAHRTGLSQPTISQNVRKLEDILGVTLFERVHKRLRPTAEAHILFEEISSIPIIIRSFALRAYDMRKGIKGRLRVVSTEPLGHTLVPMALVSIVDKRPQVSISFRIRRREAEVIEAVRTGSAEVGICLATKKTKIDALDQCRVKILWECEMVCLVDESSPLAGQAAISPHVLAEHNFIGLPIDSAIGIRVRSVFEHTGVVYRSRIDAENNLTAVSLANFGMGAAIVDPYTAAYHAASHMRIRSFVPVCQVYIAMLTRPGVPRSSLVKNFEADLVAKLAAFHKTWGGNVAHLLPVYR